METIWADRWKSDKSPAADPSPPIENMSRYTIDTEDVMDLIHLKYDSHMNLLIL